MIDIKYDDTEVKNALRGLADDLKDLKPVMKSIGAALLSSTQMRFRSQSGPDGKPWPATKRSEEGGQILRKTGRLRNSLTYEADSQKVEVGTNVVYAAFCQFGTKAHEIRPKNKKALFWKGAKHPMMRVLHPGTAPRPFLGINEDDKAEILAIIADHLKVGKR